MLMSVVILVIMADVENMSIVDRSGDKVQMVEIIQSNVFVVKASRYFKKMTCFNWVEFQCKIGRSSYVFEPTCYVCCPLRRVRH